MKNMIIGFCLISTFSTISISAQADTNDYLRAEVLQRIQLRNAAIRNDSLENKGMIAKRIDTLSAAFSNVIAELAKRLDTTVSAQNLGEIVKNGSATNAEMMFKFTNNMICELSWFPGGKQGPGFVRCVTSDGITRKTEFDSNGSLTGAL